MRHSLDRTGSCESGGGLDSDWVALSKNDRTRIVKPQQAATVTGVGATAQKATDKCEGVLFSLW
jgi:hypothetical protein